MELSFLQRNVLFHGREKIDEERENEYEKKNMEEISGLCHRRDNGSYRTDSMWKQQFL